MGDILAADEVEGGHVLAGAIAGKSVGILNECVAMLARRLSDGEVQNDRILMFCVESARLNVAQPLYHRSASCGFTPLVCCECSLPFVLGAQV